MSSKYRKQRQKLRGEKKKKSNKTGPGYFPCAYSLSSESDVDIRKLKRKASGTDSTVTTKRKKTKKAEDKYIANNKQETNRKKKKEKENDISNESKIIFTVPLKEVLIA